MGKALIKFKKHKTAKKQIDELFEESTYANVIHYSCESFYDRPDGATPRITSIAVRNLGSRQTKSFSIHKIAEKEQVPLDKISNNYDDLEREMLDGYFEYVREHATYKWLHWNMRDINYGFSAIEYRYEVLGGQPTKIDDGKKYDLAKILIEAYRANYINHPRLESLLKKNDITALNFLNGAEEAEAFENGNYVKLHQSTLRKVDVMANIAGRFREGDLKTNISNLDLFSLYPRAALEWLKEHWIISLLGILAALFRIIRFLFWIFGDA
ncbi:hypothetical protein [Rhodohalobacter sulfatireducens]|uniref:Uncharacterized protein n=1 Tax=Rhodohalobacter sulfatireducens TaxID=2911366 RepID=A0ABS9KG40_9BACT|nr:hypothetical protein [Rhodohalobacter sulfatireducens]MCG2589812.1 hypothetical protein [Rhodohalobacter sulfatireducens]